MKFMIALLGTLSFSNLALAAHVIEITEPNFTAEKIELNPVTNSYVVVKPKYFINARDAYKVAWDGHLGSGPNTATHLCTFLGMLGGKVISYTSQGCTTPDRGATHVWYCRG
ncbi:MAG: hypothetical protein AB7G93_08650 [Bdellovibrionales bacterium]